MQWRHVVLRRTFIEVSLGYDEALVSAAATSTELLTRHFETVLRDTVAISDDSVHGQQGPVTSSVENDMNARDVVNYRMNPIAIPIQHLQIGSG